VSSASSARTGDGQVTITYDPTTDTCPPEPTPEPTPEPAPEAVVVTPRFTG